MEYLSKLSTGWLSPVGKIYECECYEHITEAARLVELYGYPPVRENYRLLSSDEILIKHGWVHIGRSGSYLFQPPCWRIEWHTKHHLTPEQRSFLETYSAERVDVLCRQRWEEENNG